MNIISFYNTITTKHTKLIGKKTVYENLSTLTSVSTNSLRLPLNQCCPRAKFALVTTLPMVWFFLRNFYAKCGRVCVTYPKCTRFHHYTKEAEINIFQRNSLFMGKTDLFSF